MFAESARFYQVSVKPRLKEVVRVYVAKGHAHNGPHISGAEGIPPRQSMPPAGRAWGLGEFAGANAGLLRRRVAKPPITKAAPTQSQHAKDVEGASPSVASLDRHH